MQTENSILKTIGYFDLFRYPVSAEEIRLFLGTSATLPETEMALNQLIDKKYIFCFDGFYTLENDRGLIDRRRKGNERAERLLQIAYRIGSHLQKFPFVRGVGISGSLSKDYADEGADIDFFIITKADRLWIARTLLHCLKKLSYLTGKQHWYCMNYFIDQDALVMAEKNIFIATEVLTLKPVSESEAMVSFFNANNWALGYFPNFEQGTSAFSDGSNTPWYKKLGEILFNNRLGDRIDNWLMRVTEKRWIRKEARHKLNMKGDPMGLRISKHFGRPNPQHFQKKILQLFEEKLKKIENKLGIQFEGHHSELIEGSFLP